MATRITESMKRARAEKQADPTTQAINDIAWMLYQEARGEGEEGMRDVASVLYKRANAKGNYQDAIYEKSQFTGVGEGPDDEFRYGQLPTADSDARAQAQQIAIEMVGDRFTPTVDASHYYNPKKATPRWGKKLLNSEDRGNHRFGNLSGEYGTPRLENSYE